MKSVLIIVLLFTSINSFAATSDSVCADLVTTEIKAINPDANKALLTPYWTAICKGILDHLKADADVTPGTFIDGQSSPVTGLGKIQ